MKKKDLVIWIRNLSNEEKKIMQLRFGLIGEEPLTLKEISLKLYVLDIAFNDTSFIAISFIISLNIF